MSATKSNGLRAFVTGASGFIGVNVVKQLVEDGWSVTALHRSTSDLTYLKRFDATRVVGDVTDAASLERAMPAELDAVFHVAGNVSFDSSGDTAQTRDNVSGTRNVVALAKAKGARRLVHTSTGAVFGLHDGVPVTEDTPSNVDDVPANYFRTKKDAEDIVLSAVGDGLDTVCVNPGNVVGPYDRVIWGPFVEAIANGAIKTIGIGAGSFCHIDEVAKAHITAFHRGGRGERYILAGDVTPFAEVARVVARLTGGTAPRPSAEKDPATTDEVHFTTNRTQILVCDKAVRDLGFKPVPSEVMFGDLVRWMREEGLLPPR